MCQLYPIQKNLHSKFRKRYDLVNFSGHLDRVVTGMVAQEILEACDEETGGGTSTAAAGSEGALANPALGNVFTIY